MAGILFDAVGFPWGALFVVVNQVVVIISLTVFFVKGQVGVNKNHIFCGHCVLAVENQAVRMILHDFVMKVGDKKRRSVSSPFQRVNQELTEIDFSLVDAPKIMMCCDNVEVLASRSEALQVAGLRVPAGKTRKRVRQPV